MGISINVPGSVSNQASMTGTLSIRKSTNTFEQMTGVRSSGGTSKKQLNYNHRDISGQLLRAKKPQSASAALTRAKSKVSMLQRAAAVLIVRTADLRWISAMPQCRWRNLR